MDETTASLLRFGMPAASNAPEWIPEFRQPDDLIADEPGEYAIPTATELPRLISQYQRLRAVANHFNLQMSEMISEAEMCDSARKLDLLVRAMLAFDSEHEMCVLMDHAIYNQRQNGLTIIERLLAATPPPTRSDQDIWLQAAVDSFHSIFLVTQILPGFGMCVRDTSDGELLVVADVNFSKTAQLGMGIASRVVCLDEFAMLTGAALPICGFGVLEQIAAFEEKLFQSHGDELDDEQLTELETFITRTCLHQPGDFTMATADPGDDRAPTALHESQAPQRPRGQYASRQKIGRNEPCPCGSGHKYKRCCGRGVR